MNDLGAKGIAHYNPYTKSVVTEKDGTDNHKKLADYIAGLNEDEVDSFFTLMRKLFA
jgi:hypothetical protein